MATRMKKVTETSADEILKNDIVVDEPVVEAKPEKKKFESTDLIMCHSIIAGGLSVKCRSGNYYEFRKFGAECEIEYGDLVALIRKGSDNVYLPRFVIDDEDFLAQFPQIQKIYDEMYTSRDLKAIINLPVSQMKQEIEKLPEGTKEALRSLVSTGIANGTIDSVKKIRALTEILHSDFNLISELFGR